jgi:hypothetical protein
MTMIQTRKTAQLDVPPRTPKALRILAVLCMVVLSACGGATAVTGTYAVGKAYNVELQRTWSSVSPFHLNRQVKYLTIDGPLLNNFYLTEGLEVGKSIVRTTEKSRPMPVIKTAMSDTEMAEFVIDTIAAFGYESVTSVNMRPAQFGSADAIRFDVTAKTDNGLDILGTSQVAMVKGKVHVMLFLAPGEYYYPNLLSEVTHIFGSVRFRP